MRPILILSKIGTNGLIKMTKLNGSWADHKWLGFPLVISLSVCFLFFFYGKVLVQPNSYLFSTSGDGIKNYYTYAYHIKHDTSFHHFKGFLYPYGDLQIMTDGHPLLSWVVQLLKIPFPGIVEYSVGILNSLMLWSYLLCALTLYGLLRTYGLSRVIAAFGGFSIMILCPQFDRLYGHLSLSYAFFIPLLWLLLRKFELTDKNRYLWFLLFSSAAFYFTHPYLGVIGTFWLLLLSVVGTIHAKVTTRSFDRKRFIKSITFTIVPLVVFQLYVLALNKFKDRPLYRFDFGSTMGQLKSIFLPHHQPFVDIFKSLTGVTDQNWEAWSYVGIWTFFMLVFILVWVLFSVFQKKGYPLKGEELIILVCSIIGLVFSFGFPITSMTFLLDLVPPIRQIRVLARFSWLFYFGSGIFALVTFAKWCRSQQHGEVKVLIGAFFFGEP